MRMREVPDENVETQLVDKVLGSTQRTLSIDSNQLQF